jgi:predicted TIM-barrel fold metal-dependent hydrolase
MTNDTVFTVISSDGHAGARMADYRPYLEQRHLAAFDEFLVEWDAHGSRSFDRPAMELKMDAEFADEWTEKFLDTDRVRGFWDPERRIKEVEREGITAEIIFPDFGLPFELYSGSLASARSHVPADAEQIHAGMRAFNRWLADYVSVSPERFAGMAFITWQQDPKSTVAEIQQAHGAGLKGIVLPKFEPEMPLFHPDFEDVWSTLEELKMVVNAHGGMSATSNRPIYTPGAPHVACSTRMYHAESRFYNRNILSHLIWGGVLERHPSLKVAFTEMGTGWVIPALADMDYVYEGSYFRTDYRDVMPSKPSEYYHRQCYMGSSIFSRAEVAARESIGLDQMMLGMDFPHHEGTLLETTRSYLRASLGAEHVPPEEARQLLGANAAKVFDFDLERLAPIAARLGMSADDVLTPPEEDLFPRGDLHKPLNATY